MTITYLDGAGLSPSRDWGRIGSATALAIKTQNEGVAAVFYMPVDDTITTVGFVNGSVNGTATSIGDDTYTISLQGLTTGGVPDGTILGGGTPASATFPQSGQAGGVTLGTTTSHILTLANSIALQGGTKYALVIQHTGATDATNYINPNYVNGVLNATCMPYVATANSTPVWTRAAGPPLYWFIRSASMTYLYPFIAVAAQTVGTTTEKGFTFSRPSGYGTSNTYGVIGVRTSTSAVGGGQTVTCNLYSNPGGSNPTILQTTGQLDSDHFMTTVNRSLEFIFPEDTLAALVPGTTYAIGFSCTNAASASISTWTLPDANSRSAYGWGALTYCTRTLASAYPPDNSDGAFAETTTTLVDAELILGAFTAASPGGLRLAGHGGLAA